MVKVDVIFQIVLKNITNRTVYMYICTKILPYREFKGIGNEILDVSEQKESKCSKTATYIPLYRMQ